MSRQRRHCDDRAGWKDRMPARRRSHGSAARAPGPRSLLAEAPEHRPPQIALRAGNG